ncbi:insulin gene enhancer protein isl-1-like [Brachyhypopomus gauderio]|uniref:insulin gene enhancer protein isl-1-like n=1 Tax=Brachyhypopomus gauderio TaxID=698409 RepID=UPI0040415564
MDPEKQNGVVSVCAGCGQQILDRYILRVFPDLEWHAACLKCAACQRYLDESLTCFIKDGKTLCKDDYRRLYAIKCAKCHKTITRQDHVMRAHVNIYHVHCFRCEGCDRQLLPGDEFTFREGYLFCTSNHQLSNVLMASSAHAPHRNHPERSAKEVDTSNPNRECEPWWSGAQNKPEKTTRVRTILSESQLQLLWTCYSTNPKPDAVIKERLVEMTGLSPRVIRVWFQNKRCKDKKRSVGGKHTQLRTLRQVDEEAFSTPSPDGDILARTQECHIISPCLEALSGVSLHSDSEWVQDQCLVSASCVQDMNLHLSCAAGREVVPVETELTDSPRTLTSSPAQGNR